MIRNPPAGFPRILPHLSYDDVGAAIAWLTEAFGFSERSAARHTAADGTVERTQMQVGDSMITMGRPSIHADSPADGVSSMLYVYVDDVDAHYARARSAGAKIAIELTDRPWGDRLYQTSDPEGHRWVFAQHLRDVEPDVCEHGSIQKSSASESAGW